MENIKVQKYSEYKDSGVQWLWEIPSHWEVLTVKRLGKTKAGGTPSTTNLKFWDGNIPWLPSGKLQNCEINTAEKFITESGLKNSATKLIKPNTTMIALTGATCANIGYLKFEACANQSVIAIEEYENVNSKFLYYALINERNQILLSQTGGAQAGINETDVKNIILPTPTYTEQTAIAAFLDRKTALIDQAIDIKQKQIELLKERRQILIHKAVTRGLNPHVKLKDSGVEWIGEIPEHWEISRLKNHIELLTGFPFKSEKYSESGIKLARGINVKEGVFNWDETRCWPEVEKHLERYLLKEGDVLISMDGSKVGKNFCKVKEVDLPILLLQRVARLRPISLLLSSFLYDHIVNRNFLLWVEMSKTDPMVPHIAPSDIYNFQITIPPLAEQISISEFIEISSSKIATAISLKEQEIEKLKEYKATLINSAVTGKIKVTNDAK